MRRLQSGRGQGPPPSARAGAQKKKAATSPKEKTMPRRKKRELMPRPNLPLASDPMLVEGPVNVAPFHGDAERASKEAIRAVLTRDCSALKAVVSAVPRLHVDVPHGLDMRVCTILCAAGETLAPSGSSRCGVRRTIKMDFAENNIREDLKGLDTCRNVVVLARELGKDVSVEDVEVESLLPDDVVKRGHK